MTVPLLDANVLIAATFTDHAGFSAADAWLAEQPAFAVCPIVEGALLRFAVRVGLPGPDALRLLALITGGSACRFWPDAISYGSVDAGRISGHRQWTDAYLVALARAHDGVVVTFDRAMHLAHPDATILLN